MYCAREWRSLAGSPGRAGGAFEARRGQPPQGPGQRGGSRLKLIVFLAVVAALIYTGVKVIPLLVNNMEFQDAMESTARFASVNRQSAEDIRAAVFKQAQDQGIPITAADIHSRAPHGLAE